MQPLPSQLAVVYSEHAVLIELASLVWLTINLYPSDDYQGIKRDFKGKREEKREYVGERRE